ncbi:hypothetical protein FHS59_001126 [Algoriphagus iocasae]|uniref:Uncharacterized protein n=1 Tax=Algoriphagus iocasae TaxID=1836499 RepID=A0A841MU17_9BACT|nr:hypothetical protein [Algoriphagus iocasae]MBB6325511.1 hypothetical protein [Algoriphagus iocasae]
MSLFSRFFLFVLFLGISYNLPAQRLITKRSSFYLMAGTSGAKLRQFDQLLEDRGLTGLRNKYHTIGLGYQARYNDFVIGMEVYHNRGGKSELDDFKLNYRTSRALLNIGYAFIEESNIQLIHYMSIGAGFLNFQMLPQSSSQSLEGFLAEPSQGFILREKNIQKGTRYYGNFLTETGFQLSYDFDLPGRKEALEVLLKLGYAFSPFEGKWNLNGLSFDNAQSGAFIRVGAGLTLPDRNFFYKDASIGLYLINGIHFTSPDGFNEVLESEGFNAFDGKPSNLGLRILGESGKFLYGADIYNLAMSGSANNIRNHTLNSLRVYGNLGMKFIQYRNFAIGGIAGLGFGNIRYTNTMKNKPDFPELFEQRTFDGYLRNSGLMAKPELYVEYGIPIGKRNLFDVVFNTSVGYELPLANYKLADFSMASYMSAPYLSFGIGVRP